MLNVNSERQIQVPLFIMRLGNSAEACCPSKQNTLPKIYIKKGGFLVVLHNNDFYSHKRTEMRFQDVKHILHVNGLQAITPSRNPDVTE